MLEGPLHVFRVPGHLVQKGEEGRRLRVLVHEGKDRVRTDQPRVHHPLRHVRGDAPAQVALSLEDRLLHDFREVLVRMDPLQERGLLLIGKKEVGMLPGSGAHVSVDLGEVLAVRAVRGGEDRQGKKDEGKSHGVEGG